MTTTNEIRARLDVAVSEIYDALECYLIDSEAETGISSASALSRYKDAIQNAQALQTALEALETFTGNDTYSCMRIGGLPVN